MILRKRTTEVQFLGWFVVNLAVFTPLKSPVSVPLPLSQTRIHSAVGGTGSTMSSHTRWKKQLHDPVCSQAIFESEVLSRPFLAFAGADPKPAPSSYVCWSVLAWALGLGSPETWILALAQLGGQLPAGSLHSPLLVHSLLHIRKRLHQPHFRKLTSSLPLSPQ